jgi:predicted TIM-barrel fold metal-dependent hydrolase
MSTDRPVFRSLFDYGTPLEERWKIFKPYYEAIRHGSYARAAILTARMVYGVDGITDDTYVELSERIAAENTPGIYKRMLTDRCRITASMTQCGRTDVERPLVPLMPAGTLTNIDSPRALERLAGDESVKDLDGLLAIMKKTLERWVAEGAIGIKHKSEPNAPADRKAAEERFAKMMAGEKAPYAPHEVNPLHCYLVHQVIDMAAELDLVVAVHAGIWGDYRNLDCKHMLTLAPAHPNATFDLYHLGMPHVRDAIVIGKNLPNVCLNLCWTHIISQVQTCSGIDELLDQVPVNKVFAFGGDYHRPIEKVVGHLHMARENFARVFGARIDRGLMSYDDAVAILRMWFWDNPLRVYRRLSV